MQWTGLRSAALFLEIQMAPDRRASGLSWERFVDQGSPALKSFDFPGGSEGLEPALGRPTRLMSGSNAYRARPTIALWRSPPTDLDRSWARTLNWLVRGRSVFWARDG
jgi:hypothetical protein